MLDAGDDQVIISDFTQGEDTIDVRGLSASELEISEVTELALAPVFGAFAAENAATEPTSYELVVDGEVIALVSLEGELDESDFLFAGEAADDVVDFTLSQETLTISPLANDAPSDGASTLFISQVDGVPVDPGDTITLEFGAKVVVNDDGTLTYAPGFEAQLGEECELPGHYAFSYASQDENGLEAEGSVVVEFVEAENSAPIAVDDSASAGTGVATVIDVLANDSDPDGDPLSVVSATADNGTVEVLDDGTLE